MSDDDEPLPDLGAGDLPVFEAMAKRLAAKGDFARLERAMRKMLHAVGTTKLTAIGGRPVRDVERDLLRQLREIYRDHLRDSRRARGVARLLVSEGTVDVAVEDRLALAQMLQEGGDHDEAAEHYAAALPFLPSPVGVLHQLFAVHVERRDADAAGCVASVLAYHGAATPEELACIARTRRERLPDEVRPLDRAAWRLLAGAGMHGPIDAVFEAIARPVFAARAGRPSSDLLDARFVPPELELHEFRAAFAWARACLGLPPGPHFADLETPLDAPLPSLAGARVDDDGGGTLRRHLLFAAGRQAVFHRPAHLILHRHGTIGELEALFLGAVSLVRPDTPVAPRLAQRVALIATHLGRTLRVVARERLTVAVEGFFREGARVNLESWRRAQEILAARAGLLLSGDFQAASRVLAAERHDEGTPVEELMRELGSFAASPAHFALRRLLHLDAEVVLH